MCSGVSPSIVSLEKRSKLGNSVEYKYAIISALSALIAVLKQVRPSRFLYSSNVYTSLVTLPSPFLAASTQALSAFRSPILIAA